MGYKLAVCNKLTSNKINKSNTTMENIKTNKVNAEDIMNGLEIKNWQPADALLIYEHLEKFNWAPWLAASVKTLIGRANTFPAGQLIMKDNKGIPLASLSTNRINWDGNLSSLPSWDQIAGEPTTYENTYVKNGNSLVLMSMNVNPSYQGIGIAKKMIDKIKKRSQELEVTHLIGSFRPNQFGKYKYENRQKKVNFYEYCNLKRADGLPLDGWLRSLVRNGMTPLVIDNHAMKVEVPISEFLNFYDPVTWIETKPGVFECKEVGNWQVYPEKHIAVYEESNLYGLIPFDK